MPYIIRIFGFDGFLALCDSGFFKFNCYAKTTGSLSPNFFLENRADNKIRPPFHYSFTSVSTGDLYNNINLSFQGIEANLNLTSRELIRMRKAVYASLEDYQDDSDDLSLRSTRSDLIMYPELLAKALTIADRKRSDSQTNYQDLKIEVQFENEHEFYVTSNIQEILGFDTLSAHKVVEQACLAVAKRNDRIEQMKNFSALSGFNDMDIPLFGDKLAFLASTVSSIPDEERFQRVLEIAELPHP